MLPPIPRPAAARAFLALAACAVCLAGEARGQVSLPDSFADVPVVGGLDLPVGIAFLPDGRLLVVEQVTAAIKLVRGAAAAAADPVGTVPEVNAPQGDEERGLLGIAVDPRWPAKPYIYVHATTFGNPNVITISRFALTGDLANTGNGLLTLDQGSRYFLIDDIADNHSNHNGGTLRFGPDGMLYDSIGEDGDACMAQDTSSLHGDILRLDVTRLPDGAGGPPARALITPADNPFVAGGSPNARLIWAFGLRNPFRFHIDAPTGRVFIADVGEVTYEEVDLADRGGLDFGWPLVEGPAAGPGVGFCTTTLPPTAPIAYYDRRSQGEAAVISATVYRRPPGALQAFPTEYEGNYFFCDYYTGNLRRLIPSGATWRIAPAVPGQPSLVTWATGLAGVSDYLVGPDGAIWYCLQYSGNPSPSGEIRRIVGSAPPDTVVHVEAAFQNPYPLPGPGFVHIVYTLSADARVELGMYDVRGSLVRRLVPEGLVGAGSHPETWDGVDDNGRAVRPGVYFARLSVNGSDIVRRVPMIR